MQGFLLIDKPTGMTSHDVVDRVRKLTGERRVGHAGTLDPFATGLLIVGVSRPATREMQKLVGLDKKYEAEFLLGARSDTDDRTGTIEDAPLRNHPQPLLKKEEGLREVLETFVGEIEQIPPAYSAIKIGGKKMYEEARKGRPMRAGPRQVTIYSIDLLNTPSLHDSPAKPDQAPPGMTSSLSLNIHCSTGTYIRAIARDLGEKLGGGGYVQKLRRTAIGPFSIQESHALDTLSVDHLIPVDEFLARLAIAPAKQNRTF